MQVKDVASAQLWLEQFQRAPEDRVLANQMLSAFLYVSAVDFATDLLLLLSQAVPRHVLAALYIERELQMNRGKPIKMYEEALSRVPGRRKYRRTAEGAARKIVQSRTNNRQEVGSEGVLAQRISSFCAANRRFLLQPAASELRNSRPNHARVRHLIIVTDFIGSGARARSMLSSLWQVRSVRSWHSGKLVRITVLAYSGTSEGINNVRNHASRPNVLTVVDCPTIQSSFTSSDAALIRDLCLRYGDFDNEPLGYLHTEALIAFEHSCPNNVPAVFIKERKTLNRPWQPLFPKRSTLTVARELSHIEDSAGKLALETMRYGDIANAKEYARWGRSPRTMVVVLAAFSRNLRSIPAILRATQLPLWEIAAGIDRAQKAGLLNENRRLTAAGRDLLKRLTEEGNATPLAFRMDEMYYPTALRVPVNDV